VRGGLEGAKDHASTTAADAAACALEGEVVSAQFVRPSVAAVGVLIAACALHGPTPVPRIALGCWRVSVEGWTAEAGDVVGFSELPQVIALDTVRSAWESIVLVPRDWSWISWKRKNRAYWSPTAGDWLLLPGDTIIYVPGKQLYHEMADDSIRVTWTGLGSVTAFLGVRVNGYGGVAQVLPRQLARNLPPMWVELERMRCSDWTGSPLIDPRTLTGR